MWALLSDPEGQTTSESRHLYPPVQESSYGSPLTPAKRPKRKVIPKRRQERPVAPPKKRRRKLHRMDHYAAETRQDKVSLSIVPKLCGGQVWVKGFLQCLGLKISWISFRKTQVASSLAWSPEKSDTSEVNINVRPSWAFSKIGKKNLLELVALKRVLTFRPEWLLGRLLDLLALIHGICYDAL